jgi:hypothetical protein
MVRVNQASLLSCFKREGAMNCPLLIYKGGKFSIADPVPEWYMKMQGSSGKDWLELIQSAGFTQIELSDAGTAVNHVSVFTNTDGVFYAEFWNITEPIWVATFGWEEWPLFLAHFVLPPVREQLLYALERIQQKIIECVGENRSR